MNALRGATPFSDQVIYQAGMRAPASAPASEARHYGRLRYVYDLALIVHEVYICYFRLAWCTAVAREGSSRWRR